MPRPTKLTPETQARIIQALEAGNYFETACGYAGVSATTGYNWMNKGRESTSGIYFEFLNAVEKASSNAEARNVALIQQAAKDTWQAAAWWLERRAPDRWGRQRQEITGANGGDIVIKVVRGNQDTSE